MGFADKVRKEAPESEVRIGKNKQRMGESEDTWKTITHHS